MPVRVGNPIGSTIQLNQNAALIDLYLPVSREKRSPWKVEAGVRPVWLWYIAGILTLSEQSQSGQVMAVVERSADWFKQAKRDLENALHELRGGYYEWSCFLAQQAAEKGVKAAYQKLGAEAFGHSVTGLLESLPEDLRPGVELLDVAKELDKAYIPTRYPNVHPRGAPYELYTEAEARRLIGYAERILGFCQDILSRI